MPTNDREAPATTVVFETVVAQAISATIDDDSYWSAIARLQKCDPAEVIALVAPLANHSDPRLRSLVPNVLRYLGGKHRPVREQTVSVLEKMLKQEHAPSVLYAIATAFVDLAHPSAITLLRPLVGHPDPEVRMGVVHGLLPVANGAVSELIRLSRDDNDDVRNWATFGLGSQLGEPGDPDFVDTPEVRAALADRLDDPHPETRAEAALGLAKRSDERAVHVVARELRKGTEWTHYVEAAELLADPRLYDALVSASASEKAPADLSAAIAACGPKRST